MTASVRTLGTFTIGLAALATIPATPLSTPINASAAVDASAARLDGRVIVYVDEHGRGRVATIAEVTGQRSADGPTSPVCGAWPSP